MRKIIGIFSSLALTLSFFFVPQLAFALNGPVGVNQIRTEAGPGAGQITLNWQRYYSDVSDYKILYGTSSGKYVYGVDHIGNIATYTIGSLRPGVTYYFRLYPYRNGVLVDAPSPEIADSAIATPRVVIGSSGPVGQRALRANSGPGRGQVTLTWMRINPDVDNYHIVYGLQPGKYIYGAQNVGAGPLNAVNKYIVSGLVPGRRYYFAVTPSRGGQSLYDSAEVSQIGHN